MQTSCLGSMVGAWLLWLSNMGQDRPNGRQAQWYWLKRHPPIFLFSLFRPFCVRLWRRSSTAPPGKSSLSQTCSSPSHPLCPPAGGSMEDISFTLCMKVRCRERAEKPSSTLTSMAGLCTTHPALARVEFSRSVPLRHHHPSANFQKRNSWKCILSTQLTWSTSGLQRECCERFEIAALWKKKWFGVIIDT